MTNDRGNLNNLYLWVGEERSFGEWEINVIVHVIQITHLHRHPLGIYGGHDVMQETLWDHTVDSLIGGQFQ